MPHKKVHATGVMSSSQSKFGSGLKIEKTFVNNFASTMQRHFRLLSLKNQGNFFFNNLKCQKIQK